ncbi:LpqB family beta-propeller domain-containing protein [Amycolatopsis sp. cg5]|uniref:LpqB family beta-propeller domain-containing protein n=1 Tax=Amycolatopsis sp. cg5 TaxID=3238802 RepID=UPI0035244F7C
MLLASGCANIPAEMQPVVLSGERPAQAVQTPQEPEKGLDALTVVRDFIKASALTASGNASPTASVYLDEETRKSWSPVKGLTIIEDTFGTVYAPEPEQSADPNEKVVLVRGFMVGTLGQDSAFIPAVPASGDYILPVHVRLQADGQWRITGPLSNNLVITERDFSANYFKVAVNFFSQDSGVFVPDLRYVFAKPQSGLPNRVMDLVVDGPSEALKGAVMNLLGPDARLEQNVKGVDDGSLVVPLTGLGDPPIEKRRLILAQIVFSLQNVTTSRIKVLSDGKPILPDKDAWRVNDLASYPVGAPPELPGLYTAGGGIYSLADGRPLAGNPYHDVVSAAQSLDGKRLAAVEKLAGDRMVLRIGAMDHQEEVVSAPQGEFLTRPTWRAATGGAEVWTAVDGTTVLRAVLTGDGKWKAQGVNATDLLDLGKITALRLSRDGARVAAVVADKLMVAAVVRTPEGVRLTAPRSLRNADLTNVTDVDWASQDTLVAVTSSTSQPVVKVPVDGRRMDGFNSSNLTAPVGGVTASPNKPTIVADSNGLWVANELGEVWRPHARTVKDARPFYPG